MPTVRWVSAVALAICVVSGCGDQGEGVRRLSIATGGTGGVFYPYGGGIASLISAHIEGVEATAEVTAASVDNLKFLARGTSDLAFTMADTARDAVIARDEFADFGAVPVRALAVLYPSYSHLVTRADSGIASVEDLRGRLISTGAAGSGTAVLAVRTLQAVGLTPGTDVRTQSLGAGQSADALKDGKIDAFFWNGGLPTAAVLDLANTPGIDVRLVPTDGVLSRLEELYGVAIYYRETIPASTYGLDTDTPVVAVSNLLVASESMAESLAYDITKLLFERQAELATIHPQGRALALSTAAASTAIPYHPGAIRYYREQQVWPEP
jgi:TRAP transporter TAXI family solute receptor